MRLEITQAGKREVKGTYATPLDAERDIQNALQTVFVAVPDGTFVRTGQGVDITVTHDRSWPTAELPLTYREIALLTDLWGGYVQHGQRYVRKQNNGIWMDDYSSLIAKGLVEEFVADPAINHEDEIAALKQDALAMLHTGPTRAAIELLEQAEQLEETESEVVKGFRLSPAGIAHMEKQEDAIPAYANA